MSQNLKRAGYVGMALTGLDASINIRKACTAGEDVKCRQTQHSETGKAVGNVLGGIGLGYIATVGTCSLVFSLPSGGTSMFWCALVVGAGGGYAGGLAGGLGGEEIGKVVYETNTHH